MADPALFQAYMNSRKMSAPAFTYDAESGFKPTAQSQQVINVLKEKAGKQFNLQPANSVMAIQGEPMWGTGGGVVWNDNPSTGIVDPLEGTVHVVAHEGGHSVFPSKLKEFSRSRGFAPVNPLDVPRDTGQRMRYVHEIYAKPILEEEARAQGVAYGVLNKLGIPAEEKYQTPIDYPRSYMSEGLGRYAKTEIGPPSPGEMKEADTLMRGINPFLNRMFAQGQSLIQ